MQITINNQAIDLKINMKTFLLYENITDSSFTATSMTDLLTFFYCIVVSSMDDYSLSFDDFLNWVNDNPDHLSGIYQWIIDSQNNQSKLTGQNSIRSSKKNSTKVKKVPVKRIKSQE
jgi:hypothetical protein